MIRSLRAGLLLCAGFFAFHASAVAGDPGPAGPYYGVFRELPITEITPEGWLAQFLERQRDGLGLHREASGFPLTPVFGTERFPMLTGRLTSKPAIWWMVFTACGLLLKDKQLTDLGLANIRYVLDHPQTDGKLGPTWRTWIAERLTLPSASRRRRPVRNGPLRYLPARLSLITEPRTTRHCSSPD